MDKFLPKWKMGDPLSAARLQAGEDRKPNISVTPPLSIKQIGGVTYLGMDRQWSPVPARITNRSSDFSDNRYYARPCSFTNSDSSASDAFTYDDYGTIASDYEEAVENFGEPQAGNHLLTVGQPVVLYRRQDDSSVHRYFINTQPPSFMPALVYVEDSDLAGDSDTDCAFTYYVKNFFSDMIGSDLTPIKRRYPKTTYFRGSDIGMVFFVGSDINLWDANEIPAVETCA